MLDKILQIWFTAIDFSHLIFLFWVSGILSSLNMQRTGLTLSQQTNTNPEQIFF